jgi:O-acetylhomoserine (thiol)-lyase
MVDNTVASPYLLNPIAHGANIVIHFDKIHLRQWHLLGGVIIDSGTLIG